MTATLRNFVLAFHIVAFLLASFATCQFEEDALFHEETDIARNFYDDTGAEDEEDENLQDYIDNRIDSVPTFVSPVERFAKAIAAPLGWLSQPTTSPNPVSDSQLEPSNGVGKLINGLTKPIRDIVGPAGRAVRGGFGEMLNMIGDRFKAIFPGTEWCGAGNIAKNSNEVGLFKNTDSCCRDHDHCKINLEAGQAEFGLRNNGIFTRSHCLCDANFYYCLKEAHSLVATNIGATYFNILRPQCFKEEYPARCIKYGRTRLRNNKCLEYEYDYTQNKTWQWFDSPDF